MAYFRWYGVDASGKVKTDRIFMRTRQEVSSWLAHQQIKEIDIFIERRWFKKRVSMQHQVDFFHHLALLLEAGVRLSDALELVNMSLDHDYFKCIIADCAYAVQQGIPLSQILETHSDVFDCLSGPLIAAGEASGKLAFVCEQLAVYLGARNDFMRKIRSALFMPMITGIFFVIILCVLLWFIVPRFEQFFIAMPGALPAFTRFVFSISHVMRSWTLVWALGGVGLGVFFLNWLFKRSAQGIFWLRIPGIGPIKQEYYYALFLKTLATLLEGGIRLVPALYIVATMFENKYVRGAVERIAQGVDSGYPLSRVCEQNQFFSKPELCAMIQIGESTGALARLILEASNIYEERARRVMQRVVMLIQPLLVMVLGLCIGVLVFALYQPILTLSQMMR